MNRNHLISIILLAILAISLFAEDGWRKDEMEILVFIQNRNEAQQLQALDLIGDVYPAAAYSPDVTAEAVGRMYVTPDELEGIKNIPLDYEIVVENLNEYSRKFWSTKQGYTSTDEIFKRMDDLVSEYPDLCLKWVSDVKSVDGRDLSALKISDNVKTDEPEPEIMFDAGIHGNEVGGPENAIMFAEELLSQYGKDTRTTALIDDREIWIFVMVNPDGRVKNTRYNSNGVDCNRNYGYMATNGFAQPETRGVRDCCLDNQFALQITYHSGMIALLYPWCRVSTAIPDKDLHLEMAGVYEDAAGYGSMRIVQSYHDYQTTGETIEWTYGAAGTLTITMEISVNKAPSDIMGYYNKNVEAMKTMIEYAGYGVEGTVTNAVTRDKVAAVISVNDYFPCYSDPTGGDYHKYLSSGSYTIDVFANGYQSTTISNVSIQNKQATVKDIVLEPNNEGRSTWAYKVTFTEVGSGVTPDALGPNDNSSFTLNSGSAIDFDMQYAIKNINGSDFKVHATGSGANYTFYASQEVWGSWKELGSGTGTQEFDLEDGNLDNARYIRIDGRCAIDAVEAIWDSPTSILNKIQGGNNSAQLFINTIGKNVLFSVKKAPQHTLSVYSALGKLCWKQHGSKTISNHTWQPTSSGMYIVRLEAGNEVIQKRFTSVK